MKFAAALLIAAAVTAPAFAADQTQIFSTQAGAVRITPIYHATAKIQAGRDIIYIDPAKPAKIDGLTPGDLILVAFEYLVFADQWDPEDTGRAAPVLFDQEMHLKTNIPDTPPVWTLHLWLWTGNPDGLFADYNPLVFCPAEYPLTDMTPAS